MVSTTIASVMELLGRFKAPETYKLVEVALVVVALVAKKLVVVIEVAERFVGVKLAAVKVPDTYKLVVVALLEVTLVKIPVEAPAAPMAVLLIVPLSTVRPFTTIASVMELLGRLTVPEIFKLVEVALVDVKLVAAKVVKEALVEVTLVPVAVVNPKAPDRVPPVSKR